MNGNKIIMRSFEKIGARAKITLSEKPDRPNRNVVKLELEYTDARS